MGSLQDPPARRRKGFYAIPLKTVTKATLSPSKSRLWPGAAGSRPVPSGWELTRLTSPAAEASFGKSPSPASFYIASLSCRQSCLAVHCSATAINTLNSSVHLTEHFGLFVTCRSKPWKTI